MVNLLWILASITAASAGPVVDAHLLGEVGTAAAPGARAGGAGVGVAVPAGAHPFDLGLRVSGVDRALDGRLTGRFYPLGVGPSVGLSVGARRGLFGSSAGTTAPIADLDAAWDVALAASHRMRISTRLQWAPASTRGVLAVGWVWAPPARSTPPPPVEAPRETPSIDISRFPLEAEVWLPHPVCQWVPITEIDARLATLPPDQRLHVQAEAHATLFSDAQHISGSHLRVVGPQGTLFVVGQPGDHLRLGDQDIAAGADGVVQLKVPEGNVEAVWFGGGRIQTLQASVQRNHATWIRTSNPPPVTIQFDQGSDEVDAATRAQLAALVPLAGDWVFELQGGFSPEGNRTANVDLANRRSRAVAEVLVELGLPASQVEVVAPAVPEDATRAAAQRVCTLKPRPAAGGAP